jgi:hypothetical protein
MLTRAAHVAAAFHTATGTPIIASVLAERMRVSVDTAEQLLAVLALDTNRPTPHGTAVNGSHVQDALL